MINSEGIEKIIPHRGYMRLIDEIRDFTNTSGVGIYYVKEDAFWCKGHFPQEPIMPGVLQIEALAQTACFVMLKYLNKDSNTIGVFSSMDKVKFYHPVKPNDILELHVELIMSKLSLYKFHGIAMVKGKKVSEAVFSAIIKGQK